MGLYSGGLIIGRILASEVFFFFGGGGGLFSRGLFFGRGGLLSEFYGTWLLSQLVQFVIRWSHYSRAEFVRTVVQFRQRKENALSRVHVPHKTLAKEIYQNV